MNKRHHDSSTKKENNNSGSSLAKRKERRRIKNWNKRPKKKPLHTIVFKTCTKLQENHMSISYGFDILITRKILDLLLKY